MSLLGGLFKRRTLQELWAEIEAMFAAGRFGDAKIACDRLEGRAEKEDPALAERVKARAAECCDRIADARILEAANLARGGHLDLAREELRHAVETARSADVLARAHSVEKSFEQRDARRQVAARSVELSREERLELLGGTWEPLQAEELLGYGDAMADALIDLEDGKAAQALATMLRLAENQAGAAYLWLEIARARGQLGELAAAEEALRTFLVRIGPDEGGTTRLLSHRELARLCHERGDKEGAIRELEAAAEALEDDPRPLLELGNYLRLIERPREAIEVLEMCADAFGDNTVEWPVTMELGLACAEAGDKDRAMSALESVVQGLVAQGNLDLPPPAAVALAKLHEEKGNLARAADLYGSLARGGDAAHHGDYVREASRLLDALGLTDEARRMRERAEGLT
jgi:tetratricopeptide (TPR) repeat protein